MNTQQQFARDFLASRNLNLDTMHRVLGRPLGEAEALLLTGSVSDGHANAESDIDLILIGGPLTAGVQFNRAGVPGAMLRDCATGVECDVTVLSHALVDDLGRRFRAAIDALLDHDAERSSASTFYAFSDEEQDLLHRLSTGIIVGNPHVIERWRSATQLDQLPTYLLTLGLFAYFSLRQDVKGQIAEGHGDNALHMLQIAVDRLSGAVLAAAGITIPTRKWRIRLLRKHEQTIGPELVAALTKHFFPAFGADAAAFGESLAEVAQSALTWMFGRRPELVEPLSKLVQRYQLNRFDSVQA